MMQMKKMFLLATPMNLSYWYNLGSLLGLMMVFQIMSGIMLTLYYDTSELAFTNLWLMHLEVFFSYFIHFLHLNFSSWLFFFLYLHFFKGFIFTSFLHYKILWCSGWTIMMLMMMVSFLGYVLPWGQMSLWGATVISNLLTTIPVVGTSIVMWIWGGYFVSFFTLKLFFTLHFLMPLILMVFITQHIVLLHFHGSSNPIGSVSMIMKDEFHPMYTYKDLLNILILVIIIIIVFKTPYLVMDAENFSMADPTVSPIHIQPEWYFLKYYAILRAIPNKLGGVLCFIMSLIAMLTIIYYKSFQSFYMFKLWHSLSSIYLNIFVLLTWSGSCLVEDPFIIISQIITLILLMYYLMNYYMFKNLF